MPNTNSWLCQYAIAQIGKPYWYATSGQISTEQLYSNTTLPALKRDKLPTYNNYTKQLGVKVHDCSGLIVGALTCDTVTGVPTKTTSVAHGATSQFKKDCKTKSNSMSNFPGIPGTLVFHTKNGKKSHVGIFVGTYVDLTGKHHEDAVVEAMGHQWGVTTTKVTNSKWDSWGQLKICTIDTKADTKYDARNLAFDTAISEMTEAPTINTDSMTPYVATVLEGQNPTLDYKAIEKAKISAMMFYGGQLYNAGHIKQTYTNPYLANQVKQCNDFGMPYAVYVNVRAKSVIEADEECQALYYMISRYSPKLGLWLSLQSPVSKDLNNKIVEVYYRYIEKWGLKARCGLYLTKTQLNNIAWDTFKDRFYLWLIDPMKVSEVTTELLQPSMFEVPY